MQRLEHYVQVGQQRLRCGYTTGTCAAAAAGAAAALLLGGEAPAAVQVDTPAGIPVLAEIEDARTDGVSATCAVQKDGGDDPDATDGLLIQAAVTWSSSPGIAIHGGAGVGRVTRPGLDQPVGSAAINSVPRSMICRQLEEVSAAFGYTGGLSVTISVPRGREVGEKTFNPRLGIVGGISILGTSGIVRPMSEGALVASIHAELDIRRAEGTEHLLVSPGNYGAAFCRDVLGLPLGGAVQCSNYIGEALDYAAASGFASLLLVGHIGKLVKCAAGVMNTHSRVADCRLETITAHAAMAGADRAMASALMSAVTTDEALAILQGAGLLEPVMASVTEAVGRQLQRRAGDRMQVEAILFSNQFGLLGATPGGEVLAARHQGGQV